MATAKVDLTARNERIISEVHRIGIQEAQQVADKHGLTCGTVRNMYYNFRIEMEKNQEPHPRTVIFLHPCGHDQAQIPRCYGAGCHNAAICPAVVAMREWRMLDGVRDWRRNE